MEVCQKYSNLIGQIDDLSNQQLWNSSNRESFEVIYFYYFWFEKRQKLY